MEDNPASSPLHRPEPRVHPAIPLADPAPWNREVRPDIEAALAGSVATGRLADDGAVEEFERRWAAYCGTGHAVGVASGTDALHLVLRAMGVGAGSEVVLPANTFVSAVEAVLLAGAVPRFADVDEDTLLLTPATLRRALTSRTRAVVAVHLYGHMTDMDGIRRAGRAAGLVVVEDATQAQGARRHGHPAGSQGHAGCFSFHPRTELGAFGDAGAVTTDNAELAQLVRMMRDHGRPPGSLHDHRVVGLSSRLAPLQAAVMTAKLRHLDRWVADRRRVVDLYRQLLAGGPVELLTADHGDQPSHHVLVARVPARDRVRARLAEAGIETGLHYPVPCHLLEPYRGYASGPLRVSEQAAGRIVSLPLFPTMTDLQVVRVCEELERAAAAEGFGMN